MRCRGGDSCGPTGVSTRCARPPHALRPCRVTRRPSLRSESSYGPCGPGWTGASRPSTASRRMRDEQSTGGLGRARSRGAVEAANAGAFGLRRHRTTAIPHPHLFQETPKTSPTRGLAPPLTSAAQSSPNHAARTTCRPIVGGAREDRDELRHSRAVNHRRAAGVEEEPEVVRVVVAATTPGPGDSGCRPQLRPGGCARFLHARMRYPARLSRRAHDEATRRGGRLRLHTLSWKEFVLFMIMGGIIAATPHTAVDLRRHRGIVVWSSGNGGCLFL